MKINLSRDINLKQVELIAELDFTDSNNPYIELLRGLNTVDDVEKSLKNIGMEGAEINMIVAKLKKKEIIKNAKVNENIILTKEYGKYEIIYIENDSLIHNLPIDIKRVKPGRTNSVTNISNNSIIKELNKSKFYKSYAEKDKKFKIIKLEKNKENKYLGGNSKNAGRIKLKWNLNLLNNKNTWYLEGTDINRIEETENIDFTDERINSLLDNNWDSKNKAMNITFNKIKKNNKAKNDFYLDFNKDITFDEFGDFNGEFKNIPIIPIDENNAMEWFVYLLKNHISSLNSYVSFDELEQIWNNEFEKTPISEKFDLDFNFENIVNQFEKGSHVYWQLMAGKDLNPFETLIKEKQLRNIIIKKKNNIDVEEDIINNIMEYSKIDKLTIIDRYVTDERHYKSLEQIVNSLKRLNDDVNVCVYTKEKDNNIIEKVKELNINYNALNQYLPHARLWIFESLGENRCFIVDNSIDFIKYDKNNDRFYIKEQVMFAEFNKNDVDKKFFEILGENNE